MPASFNGKAQYGFSGTYSNVMGAAGANGTSAINVGAAESKTISDGTTQDKANRFWQSKGRSLTSGNSENIDLFDLGSLDVGAGAGEDQLGLPLAAVELVGLLVVVAAGGGNLIVGGEGSAAAFNSIFNDSDTAQIEVRPGGHAQFYAPSDPAYPIADATNHLLKLAAEGGNVTYDIYAVFRDA